MTFQELKDKLSFSDSAATLARWILSENLTDVRIEKVVKLLKSGKPLSKILGHRSFWKGNFMVNKNVLDPRPDSETLIQSVLDMFPDKNQSLKILDLGTGSGCLLISLLMEYKNATGVGVDISSKALKVAEKNAVQNAVKGKFILGDMQNLPENLGAFDFVISNPPYIPTKDIELLDVSVKKYDPILALDGGHDGLDFFKILAENAPAPLIFVEIGQGQKKNVERILVSRNWHLEGYKKDYGNIIRVLIFKKTCKNKKKGVQ